MKIFARVQTVACIAILSTFGITNVTLPALADMQAEEQQMKILLEPLGGKTDVDHPITCEPSALKGNEQATLNRLLGQSGILETKAFKSFGWPSPASPRWKLSVAVSGSESHSATLDETNMTPAYRQLIRFILKHPKP